MSHTRRSARRLTAMLAVVGIAAVGALAMPSVALADGDGWRDGWCRQGDGQTVVVDWRATPEATAGLPQIIRCIELDPENPQYADPTLTGILKPLDSAGLDFEFAPGDKGKIGSINGVTATEPYSWHWSTGQAAPTDGENFWRGKSEWSPEAEIDSFVGVTLSDEPDKANGFPAVIPRFAPGEGEGEGEPGDGEGEGEGEPGDGEGEGEPGEGEPGDGEPGEGEPVEPGEGEPGESVPDPPTAPLPPATPPTTPGTATPGTATPTNTETPSSSQQPSRTPQPTLAAPSTPNPQPPTNRPRPPVDPTPFELPAPPMPELPPIEDPAIEPPEEGTGQATIAPSPTPSIVWGREDATRQSSAATRAQTPAPWSQLAAVAGAMVIVGGLGTAFARGLHTSTPPVVEEE